MSPTALIEQPDTLQHTTSQHTTSQPTSLAWAPARLDVHHLPEVEAWIEEHRTGGRLVLDCSAVAFIDQAAVEAILSAEQDPERRLRIARPSTAMRITFELLGHSMADELVAA